MKKFKFFSIIASILVFSMMMFTLTSKRPPNWEDTTTCDETIGAGDSRKIRIAFNEAANPNPYRKTGFEGYIPSPDLRWGNFPGSSVISSFSNAFATMNYYASVTITSPQCDDWEWKGVFDASNGNSNGEMNVKIPIDGYDARVQIKYYERRDSSLGEQDFNQDIPNTCDSSGSSRVLYTFDQVFLNGWGGSIPQPMTMIPS